MVHEFGYGNTVQTADILPENLLRELLPKSVDKAPDEIKEVERSIREPIGSGRLGDIVKPGEKIAIISSDITRPMPTYKVMEPLLKELMAAGISYEDITLVLALGSHRPHTEEERRKLAGEYAFEHIKVEDSTPSDCIHLGTTSRGTPIDISRRVAEADRRICLGNIEFHYFAGFSGGAKAIMPGVSTPAAIQQNHRFMVSDMAIAGKLEGNPIREDIEEAGRTVGIDFIVNVVLDEHKKIVKCFSGDSVKAHREGCKFLASMYGCEIEKRADIVIVSQGGAPKDINLYQTQKALDNAKHAVRDGGIIILVGRCQEGLGGSVFEEWMTSAKSPKELHERIGREFVLGGHKAAAIAMVEEKADIFMVSDMDPELVKSIFMKPYTNLQKAYDDAILQMGSNATVITMPYGGSVLPIVR